jgi:PKD domain
VRRHAAALATLVCTLTGSVAADAGAAWIEPVSISQAGVASSDPQIAVDAAGNLTAVGTGGAKGSPAIRSAFRPAGGPWEPSSSLISSAGVNCEQPRLAVNPLGAAVLVADCGSGSATMQAAYRTASGTWGTSVGLPGSGNGEEPRVAIDDAGNAVAVWAGAASTVQSAYRPAATGIWVAAGQVSTPAKSAFNPNVGMSPAGYAYAIWREKREGPTPGDPVISVMVAYKLHGAAWNTASPLTLDGSVTPVTKGEPQIDINADADRMMAWSTAATKDFMQKRTASTDLAGVSGAQSVIEASAHVELPQIALDAGGLGVATWRSEASGVLLVKAATTSSLSGAWSGPATLGGPDGLTFATAPDVAAGPAGAATVVWRAGVTATAAKRTGPGAFSAAVPISNAAHAGFGEPQVTMSDGGDSVATWSSDGTSPTHIAIAIDDVTPPVLSAIVVPSSVEVGTGAAMSAGATDTWSPSSLAWDFGDGATAGGGSVGHAYATPGDRTVTVTATDAVGNTASQTRTISVAPRPGEPSPGGAGDGGVGNGGAGTQKKAIALTVTVPKQAWKKIKRAKAIRLLCGLDVAGICSVTATVTRPVAKRLGLKVGKGARTATVGSGSVALKGGDEPGTLKAKLTGKARQAIDAATKPVPIALTVTGTAPGSEPATLSRKLRIRRP